MSGPVVWLGWARPQRVPGDTDDLSPGEHQRLEALLHADDQAAFVTARRVARHVVAAATGRIAGDVRLSQTCETCGGPHGQPGAATPSGASLAVCWSHTRRIVVAAASTSGLGIDVEPLPPRAALPEHALSPTERAALERTAPPDRATALLRWWVQKEAVLKLTGAGLDRIDPATLEVPGPGLVGVTTAPDGSPAWVQEIHLADDAVAALAVPGDQPPTWQLVELDP